MTHGKIWKRFAMTCALVATLVLQSCASATGGLQAYTDTSRGFQFLYPVGWVQVDVKSGPVVVFRDLINETENISVVINPIPEGQSLKDLGTPTEVGYRLSKSAIAPPDSGRTAELINTAQREVDGTSYYIFEYLVQLPGQVRHDVASVAVSRGQLYTLNISTRESRWEEVQSIFDVMVTSFKVG
ncbi:MAG: photosystem II reaction center PsbP [Cyanobacteria bacterium P01_C01_bin.89]